MVDILIMSTDLREREGMMDFFLLQQIKMTHTLFELVAIAKGKYMTA